MDNSNDNISNCCGKKSKSGILSGICYGLIPHCGCLLFIIFTVLGVSVSSVLFRPLLMNSYFFYGLIALSLALTTISAVIYLKRNGLLSFSGAKMKWKYLLTLCGTAVSINVILFMVAFPYAANLPIGYSSKSAAMINQQALSKLILEVDIPCSGHASLVSGELKKNDSVYEVKYHFPNFFDVYYDSSKISKEAIISLDIFKNFKARILST